MSGPSSSLPSKGKRWRFSFGFVDSESGGKREPAPPHAPEQTLGLLFSPRHSLDLELTAPSGLALALLAEGPQSNLQRSPLSLESDSRRLKRTSASLWDGGGGKNIFKPLLLNSLCRAMTLVGEMSRKGEVPFVAVLSPQPWADAAEWCWVRGREGSRGRRRRCQLWTGARMLLSCRDTGQAETAFPQMPWREDLFLSAWAAL